MSSEEAEEIYKELLKWFEIGGYINPRAALDYKVDQLMQEGKTREEAILHLYKHPENGDLGQIDQSIQVLKQQYEKERLKRKKVLAIEPEIAAFQQKTVLLNEKIARLRVLSSRGEVSQESYRTTVEALGTEVEQLIGRMQEKIAKLTVRFSQRDLDEELYKKAVSMIEESISKLPSEVMRVEKKEKIPATPTWHSEETKAQQERGNMVLIFLGILIIIAGVILFMYSQTVSLGFFEITSYPYRGIAPVIALIGLILVVVGWYMPSSD